MAEVPGSAGQTERPPGSRWRQLLAPGVLTVVAGLVLAACQPATLADLNGSPTNLYEDLNLAYASASPAEKLDLYRPQHPDPASALPVIVLVHGGGFVGGDKSDLDDTAASLVAHGYAVASVDYRLAPEATFPAPIEDVKAAIRWLRVNAGKFDLDPDRFGVLGESAGAYLAAMVGTWGYAQTPEDAALGNPGVVSTVRAVVDLFGPVDFTAIDGQLRSDGCPASAVAAHDGPDGYESRFLGHEITTVPALVQTANPVSYAGPGHVPPPFDIEHGSADCTVPYQQSEELAAGLLAAGGDVFLNMAPGAGHGTRFPRAARFPAIVAFLDHYVR